MSDLRTDAKKAILKGDYKKAFKLYSELYNKNPSDLRVHVKLAEIHEKLGDTTAAVNAYLSIAKEYAEQGFVVQAIAINKIILRLDPGQTQVKDHLKQLSSERGEDWALTTIGPAGAFKAGDLDFDKVDKSKLSFERTPLLSSLTGDKLDVFIDSLKLRHVKAGEYIYNVGDAGNHLYLIGMGQVRLETPDAIGKRKVFSHLLEGDFFGEHAFMSRSACVEAAVADSDCSLLMIDRGTFDKWVASSPGIASVVEEFYRQRVLARVLTITPIFMGIPQEARLELAQHFQLRTIVEDETIVNEGEAGDSFFLIRSGKVRVFTRSMRNNAEVVGLGTLKEGDFFGEVSLLTHKPRTATVQAQGAVELMELSQADFDSIAAKHPTVRKVVEAFHKKRVQETIRAQLKQKNS
jgi:CRP-like cAMP-binding protein